MNFEWDEAKNRSNLLKHGLLFEDGLDVFNDPDEKTDDVRMVGTELRKQHLSASTGICSP